MNVQPGHCGLPPNFRLRRASSLTKGDIGSGTFTRARELGAWAALRALCAKGAFFAIYMEVGRPTLRSGEVDTRARPAEPSVMSSDAGEVDTRTLTVKEGGPLRNDIFFGTLGGGMKRETTSSTSVEKDSPEDVRAAGNHGIST